MSKKVEHNIQCAIYSYWKAVDGGRKSFLFSVPNGGSRHKLEAINLKREGATAGVADLIWLVKGVCHFIEVKVPEMRVPTVSKTGKVGSKIHQRKGVQSDAQVTFQKWVEYNNFKYFIVYSVDEFKKIYDTYI